MATQKDMSTTENVILTAKKDAINSEKEVQWLKNISRLPNIILQRKNKILKTVVNYAI